MPSARKILSACILGLLFFGGSCPAAWAGKQVQIRERKIGPDHFRFEDSEGRLYSEMMLTTNFAIYFNPAEVDIDYVGAVIGNMEGSWDYFHRQGYEHPAFADQHRVAVYIRRNLEPSWRAGAFLYKPANAEPYLELKMYDNLFADQKKLDFVRSLCTHEFFHFIQSAYDPVFSPGTRWMWEATATWSEDERVPNASAMGSYLRHMAEWYPLWSSGVSLNRYDPVDPHLRSMPYGGAIFFKYLSEHRMFQGQVVRQIWEELRRTGDGDSMQAIRKVLGERHDEFFANFATAVALKNPYPPWGVRRAGEIAQKIEPRETGEGWYFRELQRPDHIIKPSIHGLEPFSAVYLQMFPPPDQERSGRFHLILERDDLEVPVTARVMKFTGEGSADQAGVEELVFRPRRAYTECVVENFGPARDQINQVAVVISNPSATALNISVASVILDPPYLEEVEVLRLDTGEVVYHARWEEDERRQRKLTEIANGLKLKKNQPQNIDLRVQASFSQEMADPPKMYLGYTPVEWTTPPREGERDWFGTARPSGLADLQKASGQLSIEVTAHLKNEMELDANPATVAELSEKGFFWEQYEPVSRMTEGHWGGMDRNHAIQLIGPDEKATPEPEPDLPPPGESSPEVAPAPPAKKVANLSGLWELGGGVIRVTQIGPSVTAVWVRPSEGSTQKAGWPCFEATLNGDRLDGKLHVSLPEYMWKKCPQWKDSWTSLKLTVSAEGTQLSGIWVDELISKENCRVISSSRAPISMSKIEGETTTELELDDRKAPPASR